MTPSCQYTDSVFCPICMVASNRGKIFGFGTRNILMRGLLGIHESIFLYKVEMSSVQWANNHQKQLTQSVVFSNTNTPRNVGLNKFLQPTVQYVPAVKKTKQANKPVELVYINSIPPPPVNKGISITKPNIANAERTHQACMQMMANRRAKSASKSGKVHTKRKTRKTRKTRKARKTHYS